MNELYLAERIAKLRTKRNVSARDMSLSIGQNENYINHIENGKALPSMTAFFYICEYLDISPKDFFDDSLSNPIELAEILLHLDNLNPKQMEHVTAIIKDLAK